MTRTQETMRKRFIVKPEDVFTVKKTIGLTSRLSVNVKNRKTKEDFNLTFDNNKETKDMLDTVDAMLNRRVIWEQ